MKRFAVPVLGTLLLSAGLIALAHRLLPTLPPLAAREGEPIQQALYILFDLALVIFSLCVVFLLYSLWAFRRRPGEEGDGLPIHGHTGLEVTWTLVPLFIVLALGSYGTWMLVTITRPPEDAVRVRVTGFQWAWRFEYPDLGVTSAELVLPVDRPVAFELTAADVIHSFWIPEFRIKMDAIPGRINRLVLTPDQIGTYRLRCAEMCGLKHAYMLADVRVVAEEEFQAWVQAQTGAALSPAERGRQVAEQAGCLACHSVDGAPSVGPTWKGLFGSTRTLADGSTAVADEAYLYESIVDPGAKVVEGFPDNVMPRTFGQSLTEEQIRDLIEYIKTLK